MPRIAVVQIEPSYMDPAAGLARIEEFTAEAAGQGAEIVVFPELLVPGYPRYVGDPFPHTDGGPRRPGTTSSATTAPTSSTRRSCRGRSRTRWVTSPGRTA